ncbi:MAG: aminotransferase class V-fold PLP-dependent enzyme [Candidatus Aminicenantes bacterium]|nr:aminotransferase class V-fold PLP-dependent enzyme [Candidatus Aminicenantes bacterium]
MPTPTTRREFVRSIMAGTALSAAALAKANAEMAQSITSLNMKYLDDEAPDGAYWDAVRAQYLFEDNLIMMNNGTVGPMPKPVFNRLMGAFRRQAENPYDVYNFLPSFREAVRTKLAAFVHAAPDEVALTSNTTEGINFVVNGLDLNAGDEVLISNLEHPGGIGPVQLKAKRSGIVVKEVPIGPPHGDTAAIVSAFEKAVTPKTKLIMVSHTCFITGLITPIKELSKMAHDKGLLVLADSAHGLGIMDLNMHDMGVDFFCSSPYKWMGTPCGIGLLYVRKDVQEKVWPTVVSSGWDRTTGARKLDPSGQRADAMILALDEALDFQNRIGRVRIERRIKALSGRLKQGLAKTPGVKINTPADPYLSAGLTAFALEGVAPAKIVDFVREKYNLVIRTIGNTAAGTAGVRVSTPIFVTSKEVDMLLEGIGQLARNRS